MSHLRKIGQSYFIYWRENGKLRGKKASNDNQTAKRIQNELDRRLDHQSWGLPAPLKEISWENFCDKYTAYAKENKTQWQVATQAIKDLTKKIEVNNVGNFNRSTLEKYKAVCLKEGRQAGGINRYLQVFTNMGTMLVEWGFAQINPVTGLKKAKGEHSGEVRILTNEEIGNYFNIAWGNYTPFGMSALHTGGRPGEVLMLQLSDFDLDHNIVKFNDKPEFKWHVKTYQRRSVPLLPQHREYILKNFVGKVERKALLINNDGKPIKEASFRYLMTRFIRPKINIPKLVPYTFRHTYAANVLFKTKDLWGLSRLLGHRSVRTTELYYAHFVEGYHEGPLTGMTFAINNPIKPLLKNKKPESL
jgi:site-specific recombinase XerD